MAKNNQRRPITDTAKTASKPERVASEGDSGVSSYAEFIRRRSASHGESAITDGYELNRSLFPHQKYLVEWALARGRAAVFADTGLGKTIVQLEWARVVSGRTGGRVLVLAPLAVADQTVREAARFGVPGVEYSREDTGAPITVTNYEMLSHFDPSAFAGVVLDESSILKAYTGAFRNQIIEAFSQTDYRLACTATPAPNDFTELGNHSEFLGIKSRVEMLAEYFINDTGDTTSAWRLKGHAERSFWQWVAVWARALKDPADIGFDGSAYTLPALRTHDVVVSTDQGDAQDAGMLFLPQALSLSDQRAVRKATMAKRVRAVVEIDKGSPGDPLLVWCELNNEADAIADAIPGAVQVAGSDSLDDKRAKLLGFANGDIRALVTKPSIAGFGMNWQHCRRVVFAGASHSYEKTYQAIRRCWRFGQTKPVDVWMIRSDREHSVWQNYRRKERDAARLASGMMEAMRADVGVAAREWNEYEADQEIRRPAWMF